MNKHAGPAFPYSALQPDPETRSIVGSMYADNQGMSLRDYFAGQALIGFLCTLQEAREDENKAATWAYEQADAMLKAREVEQ